MSKFNKPAPRLTKNNSFNKFSNNALPKIITPLVEEVKPITLPEPVIIEIKPVKVLSVAQFHYSVIYLPIICRIVLPTVLLSFPSHLIIFSNLLLIDWIWTLDYYYSLFGIIAAVVTMGDRPIILVLHGMPACGKYTIGKQLTELLQHQPLQLKEEQEEVDHSEIVNPSRSWAFFHNHLIVDAVMTLFPFGSLKFKQYREQIWLSMIPDAIREKNKNILFTFSPDITVNEDFPMKLQQLVEEAGGEMIGIQIICSNEEEVIHRLSTRKEFEKLKSIELYQELMKQGAFASPDFRKDLVVDSFLFNPEQSAKIIAEFLSKR